MLLEGEELSNVPDGVKVVGRRVKHCLGSDGCRFQPLDKPLFCGLSPVVCAETNGFTGGRRSVLSVSGSELYGEGSCPVIDEISEDFIDRVCRCVELLKRDGLWRWGCGLKLPRATVAEILTIKKSCGIDLDVLDRVGFWLRRLFRG